MNYSIKWCPKIFCEHIKLLITAENQNTSEVTF